MPGCVTEVLQVGALSAEAHALAPLPSHSFPRTPNPDTGSHVSSALPRSPTATTEQYNPQEWKFHFKSGKQGSRTACPGPQPSAQLILALGTASPEVNFHTIHKVRGICGRQTPVSAFDILLGSSRLLPRLRLPGAAKATQSRPLHQTAGSWLSPGVSPRSCRPSTSTLTSPAPQPASHSPQSPFHRSLDHCPGGGGVMPAPPSSVLQPAQAF